jgi:hypothetical protein
VLSLLSFEWGHHSVVLLVVAGIKSMSGWDVARPYTTMALRSPQTRHHWL